MSGTERIPEGWATFEALRAHGPTKGETVDSGVVYAVTGLVSFLGYAPREPEPVPTASVVRHLLTTRDTLMRGWKEAERASLIARESRKEPGQPRKGYIRFTNTLLDEIDRIIAEGEVEK